jgi:hypothetical protein
MSSSKPSAKKKASRAVALEALKLESEKNLREQIDRLLAKPMQERRTSCARELASARPLFNRHITNQSRTCTFRRVASAISL